VLDVTKASAIQERIVFIVAAGFFDVGRFL
jgi:hypothetical protein